MIVSHHHKFIFVKTRKTAGTSLEIALSAHCGPDDVMSAISTADDEYRNSLGHRGPQHHLLPWRMYSPRTLAGAVRRRRRRRCPPHMRAPRIRKLVGEQVWDEYFTFTVERNPYDKAVSGYWWRTRDESPRPPINEYLRDTSPHVFSDWGSYTIDGEIAVDRVLSYEDLPAELDDLGHRLGVEIALPEVRAKGGHRLDRTHYSEVLDAASRARIEQFCRREIAAFGYRWEP